MGTLDQQNTGGVPLCSLFLIARRPACCPKRLRARRSDRDKYPLDALRDHARQIHNSRPRQVSLRSSRSAHPLRSLLPAALPAALRSIREESSPRQEDQASLFENYFRHRSLENISKGPAPPESAR